MPDTEATYPPVLPLDVHNQTLLANVHPSDWVNPAPSGIYNLVVIGAGSAGLITAAAAAGLGAKVALIERHLMGGDCLNVGCVPSKALIRPAHILGDIQRAESFGLRVQPDAVSANFEAIMARMRKIRATISPNDSAQRYKELGVEVYLGEGRFIGPNTVQVGGQNLQFAKAVIATGGRAAELPIPGLREAGYLSHETVFNLTEQPQSLAVIGAGPIGCEMAQSFRRFGSEVALFDAMDQILIREDQDAAKIVQDTLIEEGVKLILSAKITHISQQDGQKLVHYEQAGQAKSIIVDEILVAVGRTPNVDGLGLEAAGVEYHSRGVTVNDQLQSTNPNIYAAGDVAMKYQFTHAADAAARIVVRNTLFKGKSKVSTLVMPWCTYTDPEIAHVGLYEHEAAQQGIKIDTYTVHFNHNDRALADGDEKGLLKIHAKKGSDKILGATIVARNAGDMISEITLAMTHKIGLGKIADVIHPYPTQAEVIRRAADAYNRTRLTPLVQKLFRWWIARQRKIDQK